MHDCVYRWMGIYRLFFLLYKVRYRRGGWGIDGSAGYLSTSAELNTPVGRERWVFVKAGKSTFEECVLTNRTMSVSEGYTDWSLTLAVL